jgi:hypothetical protein
MSKASAVLPLELVTVTVPVVTSLVPSLMSTSKSVLKSVGCDAFGALGCALAVPSTVSVLVPVPALSPAPGLSGSLEQAVSSASEIMIVFITTSFVVENAPINVSDLHSLVCTTGTARFAQSVVRSIA